MAEAELNDASGGGLHEGQGEKIDHGLARCKGGSFSEMTVSVSIRSYKDHDIM